MNIKAVIAASLLTIAGGAMAQDYPNKPVRMVVPYGTGGSTSVVAIAISKKFQELTGKAMVMDHRPGAGSNIGNDLVAKAPPDGYTILMGTSSLAINPSLYASMSYDPIKDLAPITMLIRTSNVLAVHPSLPIRNVGELIDYARKNPGKLNYASSGNGATNHLAMEALKAAAKIDIVHVPYKGGGEAMTALLAGTIQVMFNPASTLAPQHAAGRLRMIAVSSDKPIPGLDLPTVAASGLPGFSSYVWFGLFAPAGTPAPIIARLNADINQVLKDKEVAAILDKAGMEAMGGSAEDMRKVLVNDTASWAAVVKASGVKI